MTRIRWFLALIVSITLSSEASAQFFPVFGVPYVRQSGISFHVGGRRLSIDGFIPTGNPYTVIVPVTPTNRGLRQVGPAYLPYGYGYGYGVVEQRVTVQIINPPGYAAPRLGLIPDVSGIDLDLEPASKIWGERPALAKAGKDAAVIRAEAVQAPREENKVQVAANREKPPALPPPKVERLPPDGHDLNDMGLAAFKNGEFGLATLRFRQAVEAEVPIPRALFFQGQAYIAVGKYRESVEIIQKGLERQPNWPTSGFQPRKELYANQDDLWKEHRMRLEQAHQQNPKDADYLFLLGYHYWFDGQREVAVDYFQQARALATEPRWCDLFLMVAKG